MEEILVNDLINGGRESRIGAASEIGKFSSKQKQKLVEKGIILPLILMLRSEDYEETEAALLSLLSLAFGSERNKIRILESGILPVLLPLLQCQNKALIELAMATLLILTSCRKNKSAIASSGVINTLVELIMNDEETYIDDYNNKNKVISYQAKIDAIGTLHNLSTCPQIIPLMVSSGVTHSLLYLLHSSIKLVELVEKVIALLEIIVLSSQDAIQEITIDGSTIRLMVEVIKEGSSQCKEHAVAILVNICRSCRDKYRVLILREGVMPGLLQLSMEGTWRARSMARELLLLLRDGSGYGPRGKKSKNEKIIEQIMGEIDSEGDKDNEKTLQKIEKMIANLNT